MKNDMIRLEAVKGENGNITRFELEILDQHFWTVYKGSMSVTEYANLISGSYVYTALEREERDVVNG